MVCTGSVAFFFFVLHVIDARCFLGDTFGIDKLRPLLRLFYKYEPIRIHCSAQGRREEGSSRTVEVVVATEVHLRPQRGGGGRREASERECTTRHRRRTCPTTTTARSATRRRAASTPGELDDTLLLSLLLVQSCSQFGYRVSELGSCRGSDREPVVQHMFIRILNPAKRPRPEETVTRTTC